MTRSSGVIAKGFIKRLEAAGSEVAIKELASFLVDQKSDRSIDDIITSITEEYFNKYGIVEAEVKTAFPLSDKLKEKLRERAAIATGAKKVTLYEEIDKSLLGGVILSAPGVELDLSLKTKLASLKA